MGKVIMELNNITKYFPGVIALKDMSLKVCEGEVHGLIGENGAGKSTLMKCLSGVYQPEDGEILVDGEVVDFNSPIDALDKGVGCIYQELNIVPDMSITDNLFINYYHQKKANCFLDYKEMDHRASEIMEQLGYSINPREKCYTLGLGLQQIVEIGKAILRKSRIIIMDEPTSSLSENEVNKLMETIRYLKSQGIAIIFISHKLEEVFDICDNVTVMRDGIHVSTTPVSEMTKDKLVSDMVGRSIKNLFPSHAHDRRDEMLRVDNITLPGVLDGVSFKAYGGEILGFAGLVGAGRSETMRSIFGIEEDTTGDVYVKGEKVKIKHPSEAITHGLAFLTEDRKGEGLVLDDSVLNNLHLATIDKFLKFKIFLDNTKRKAMAKSNVSSYSIKTPNLDAPVGTLSGGNQQKVVVGNWVNTDADIYIFDEPTRGIDVGAKLEVYNVMIELLEKGKCIIMISSELPEILGMSDRVIVMQHGKITAEIDKDSKHFNQEDIMKAAWGGKLA